MRTVASTPVAAGTAPTDVNQLWALYYLFSCDWSNGLKIRQSFTTEVVRSTSECEQRRALVQSPLRTVEVDLQIRGSDQIAAFRSFLMRAATCRFLVPLYSEECVVTNETGGDTLVVNRAFSDTRFVVGGRCALVSYDSRGASLVVSSFVATSLSVSSIQGGTFTTNDIGKSLFPLIECEILLNQDSVIITDSLLTASMVFIESHGDYSLDSMAAIGTNPGGVSASPGGTSYPLLAIEPDFSGSNKAGVQRAGETTVVGRGPITQVFGPRGRFSYELSYAQLSRTSAMALIKHFEAMGGRFKAFWLLSPCSDFKAVSFTSTTVVVAASDPADSGNVEHMNTVDWSYFPYIGVKMLDGSFQLRAIIGTPTLSAGLWTVTVATWTTTPSLATISRLSVANLVRFDTDEMEETWITDGVMSTTLKMLELLSEKSVAISNTKDWTSGWVNTFA